MVIVGVLILFASLKLKPNARVMATSDDLIHFTPASSDGNRNRLNRHQPNRDISEDNLDSIQLRTPATLVQRQLTICSEIQRMVEHESNRCDSFDGTSIHSSFWVPLDTYGDDHQAAIEAALSTVLAVSTLVGFRAHQASPEISQQHCCLQHAIQVGLVRLSLNLLGLLPVQANLTAIFSLSSIR